MRVTQYRVVVVLLAMLLSVGMAVPLWAQTVTPTDTPVVLVVTATPVLTVTPDAITLTVQYAEQSYQMQTALTTFVVVVLGLFYLRGR